MKRAIFVILLSLIAVPAFAQSKLAIMKSVVYSKNHIYFCPGVGVKHVNLTTAQPEYWYGGQVTVELSETIDILGRLKYDFANGNASRSKPDGELGIWYKIKL